MYVLSQKVTANKKISKNMYLHHPVIDSNESHMRIG